MKKIFAALLALISVTASAAVVDTITITSTYIEPEMKVVIISPEGQIPGDRFPVVYLLHGHGGRYDDWVTRAPQIKELADQYRLMIVCPDGRNSWYFDSLHDQKMQMESFITRDLIPYIDSNYPTFADPAHRAITGLSMGGHGSLWLGLRHPEIFGSMGSMSGGLDITPFPGKWNIAAALGPQQGNEDVWASHSVINILPDATPGQNIIVDCGIDDFFATVNENVHQAMVQAKIPHDYYSRPGRHSWDYWRNAVPYHLWYFHEVFNK